MSTRPLNGYASSASVGSRSSGWRRAVIALSLDFEGLIEGEPFDGGHGEDVQLEIGAGRFIPGFEEQLIGTAVGDKPVVEVTFPEDYQQAALAGKPARFDVVVKQIEEPILPELDADLIAEFGVEDGDLERFRADVRANLERELTQRVKAQVKEQVLNALIEAHPLPIPAALLAEEIASLRQKTMQSLGGAASQLSEVKLPDELFADNARRRVALGLIFAELIEQLGLSPEPERVRATIEAIAAGYDDPQAVIDHYYADRQQLASVESVVLEDVVVEHLLEQLQVTDEPTSFSELTAQQ